MNLTRIEVHAGRAGARADVRLTAGQLVGRVVQLGTSSARVVLMSTTATLLAGDAVALQLVVGPGALLELSDVAATVAYAARGGRASWRVAAEVGDGAVLLWHGEPLVMAAGSAVSRSSQLLLKGSALAVVRETLVLGREGESGGALRARSQVTRDGIPLLVEDLDLRHPGEHGRGAVGRLGTHRVVDTLTWVGSRAPTLPHVVPRGDATGPVEAGAVRFELDGPGTVLRYLGAGVHESPLGGVWGPLRAAALAAAAPLG